MAANVFVYPTTDYTLNNPDTLTKYKSAAQISEKVLAGVSALCVAGAKIVDICEQGDKLIEEELAKVYRGKKVNKGTSDLLEREKERKGEKRREEEEKTRLGY